MNIYLDSLKIEVYIAHMQFQKIMNTKNNETKKKLKNKKTKKK